MLLAFIVLLLKKLYSSLNSLNLNFPGEWKNMETDSSMVMVCNVNYYMTSSESGQDEPNPTLWLLAWSRKNKDHFLVFYPI